MAGGVFSREIPFNNMEEEDFESDASASDEEINVTWRVWDATSRNCIIVFCIIY